jgi:hypothetical protein
VFGGRLMTMLAGVAAYIGLSTSLGVKGMLVQRR